MGERRERVLRATRSLLAERGAARLGLGEIARRAGVSRRTVYRQFGSRRGLLWAVAEGLGRAESEAVMLPGDLSARGALGAFLSRITDVWSNERALARGLLGSDPGDSRGRSPLAALDGARRREVSRLASRLERARALRPGLDRRRAADALFALTSFEVYDFLRARGGLGRQRAREILRDLGRGLLATPSTPRASPARRG
jgi:AcrR family transcriptional regulator